MNDPNYKNILKRLMAIITAVIMVMAMAFVLPQKAESVYAADDDPVLSVSDMKSSEHTGDFEEEPDGETASVTDEGPGDEQEPGTSGEPENEQGAAADPESTPEPTPEVTPKPTPTDTPYSDADCDTYTDYYTDGNTYADSKANGHPDEYTDTDSQAYCNTDS